MFFCRKLICIKRCVKHIFTKRKKNLHSYVSFVNMKWIHFICFMKLSESEELGQIHFEIVFEYTYYSEIFSDHIKCKVKISRLIVELYEHKFLSNVLFTLNHTKHKFSLWLYYKLWQVLISYCKFIMPKALNWDILGLCISIFH